MTTTSARIRPFHFTDQQTKEIKAELDSILSSEHFAGSKRCCEFLEFIVLRALDGEFEKLTERFLGTELFGRPVDYETATDAIVRVRANDVRRRLVEYYSERPVHSGVRIAVNSGTYIPEFQWHAAEAAGPRSYPEHSTSLERANRHRGAWTRAFLFGLAGALLLGAGIAGYLYHQATATGVAPAKKLWDPLLQSSRPVLIVVGTSHPDQMAPENDQTTFGDHMSNPYHHVSVSSAIALARLGGVLHQRSKDYEIKEAPETSLTDIRSRSLILVGALNNQWTIQLLKPLRIHFTYANFVASIQDSGNSQQQSWAVDFKKPYSTITTDYALVARFRDPTTEGPVLVIAGLGPYGTEAASEFVQSPQHLADLASKLPRGWEDKNLEVVLKTDVIGAKAGPPILVTTYAW